MVDFHQTQGITTLHRLKPDNLDRIENELRGYAKLNPIALILPSLYSELQGKALSNIIYHLKAADYISSIVVTLGNADREQFEHTKEFFSALPHKLAVVWNDGERMTNLYNKLAESGLSAGEAGKGRAVWMAIGYVLADNETKVVALHDCDILTYDRELLARLCYPAANPQMGCEFNKGYYMRVTDRMFGRVTRLFVTPIIRSLKSIIGHHPLLVYLDGFRYPLAGEFAMSMNFAETVCFPSDWGLEIGTLYEAYKKLDKNKIFQTELCDNYEHKHQPLSKDDAEKGLLKMCGDIAGALISALENEGVDLSPEFFESLISTYVEEARRMIKMYEDDASINGLMFDRENESLTVGTFVKALRTVSRGYVSSSKAQGRRPQTIPHAIPSWSEVTEALPEFAAELRMAVDEDNR